MKVCGLFMSICLSVGVLAGKYSREVNEQKVSDDGKNAVEFRIAKLNQVWEKANRVSKRRLSFSKRLTVAFCLSTPYALYTSKKSTQGWGGLAITRRIRVCYVIVRMKTNHFVYVYIIHHIFINGVL